MNRPRHRSEAGYNDDTSRSRLPDVGAVAARFPVWKGRRLLGVLTGLDKTSPRNRRPKSAFRIPKVGLMGLRESVAFNAIRRNDLRENELRTVFPVASESDSEAVARWTAYRSSSQKPGCKRS